VSERLFPARPVVGVGAVVVDRGRVLLVKRARPPLAGEWSLPGGAVEIGETLSAALQREVLEETGLLVEVGPIVEVLDRIHLDDAGRVEYHYVLLDYLCTAVGGHLAAGTDAADARWATSTELPAYGLRSDAMAVIARAFELARG
jgi:ADP-ribose pyrophosphatase YjhB (NUDIX family)